jgi:Cu2+-exporting ATPase
VTHQHHETTKKPAESNSTHDKHAGHSLEMFRRKFWVSLTLTIPVLFYSEALQRWFGFVAPAFPYSQYIPAFFATIIFFYGGVIFLRGAIREIRAKQPGMMTLIGLAISVAYLYSLAATFLIPGETLFWELSTLITVMLLGHYLEMKAVGRASAALEELSKLIPDTAEMIHGKMIHTVPVTELKIGDLILVRPGAKVPADGIVVGGQSSVNEAMITGESKPVSKRVESEVIAGTVNGEGSLKIRVTKIGEETALAGIMRLVAEAQKSRSKTQDLADRAAYYLTLTAIGIGGLSAIAWLFLGQPFNFALERSVAVLVIACPHALGLAVPLVTAISTSLSARSGILVRNRLTLELARKVDIVLFDKTGTLTEGEFGVSDIFTAKGWDEKRALKFAAVVEQESEHPIARAIVDAAKRLRIQVAKVESFKIVSGEGAQGKVSGQNVWIGKLRTTLPEELRPSVERATEDGKTVVYLEVNRKVIAAIALGDVVRAESKEAVASLKKLGIDVAMVTGDSKPVAESVGKELGITDIFAEVKPADKSETVRQLRQKGQRVAFVGDGVNDAPALAAADVGIAIGAGTDVAIESAGIILVKNDPRDVVKVIHLARATYRKMVENLVWATGYNVFAIPAAAGLFLPWGIALAPALAALFMSASTVIVAANAQLLRKLRL